MLHRQVRSRSRWPDPLSTLVPCILNHAPRRVWLAQEAPPLSLCWPAASMHDLHRSRMHPQAVYRKARNGPAGAAFIRK